MELNATCGKGENVVRVRVILKTKIKLFLVNVYLYSDQFKPKSYLKLIKKYIFSENERYVPLGTQLSVAITEIIWNAAGNFY